MPQRRTKEVRVLLTPDERAYVMLESESRGVSASSFVRILIREEMKRDFEQYPTKMRSVSDARTAREGVGQ